MTFFLSLDVTVFEGHLGVGMWRNSARGSLPGGQAQESLR